MLIKNLVMMMMMMMKDCFTICEASQIRDKAVHMRTMHQRLSIKEAKLVPIILIETHRLIYYLPAGENPEDIFFFM